MDSGVVQRHINGQRTKGNIQMSNDIVLVKIEDTCRSNIHRRINNKTASDTWRYNEQEQGRKVK
jgi:hypothetical protein